MVELNKNTKETTEIVFKMNCDDFKTTVFGSIMLLLCASFFLVIKYALNFIFQLMLIKFWHQE